MDDLRSFAMSLEEKDRADLGGYIAVVLQKLANMNELFLGERVSCKLRLFAMRAGVQIVMPVLTAARNSAPHTRCSVAVVFLWWR